MILYSTLLPIKHLTKEAMVELVIRWNQTSPYNENVIDDLSWQGDFNATYIQEDKRIVLKFLDYPAHHIFGVRFKKTDQTGAIWHTDFVMNFEEMKMSVTLNRTYSKDSLMEITSFAVPYFVKMLMEEGYVEDDHGLPYVDTPITIHESEINKLADLMNRQTIYDHPVVYVSRTIKDRPSVNVEWLARNLKGAAHVLVQSSNVYNEEIRYLTHDQNEYFGSIGVYFPKSIRKVVVKNNGTSAMMMEKILKAVMHYQNTQQMPSLYTWFGLQNAVLEDQLSLTAQEVKEARAETEEYANIFDEDNRKLSSENKQLRAQIDKLEARLHEISEAYESKKLENQELIAAMNDVDASPLLHYGNEREFYNGEIREIVLDAIDEVMQKTDERARRHDIYQDIIDHNHYDKQAIKKQNQVKECFKNYKKMTPDIRRTLKDLGFELGEDGKHYRLIYYGDERYATSISKTGSDHREGKNIASVLKKMML